MKLENTMKSIAILAVSGLMAAPAFAGGPVIVLDEPMIEAPAPMAVATNGEWGGMYAGVQLGYADVGSNGAGLDGTGVIGGVHAGYRYDLGMAVVGAEVDYDAASVELGTADGTLDSVARLKLMAGADLGSALVYGTFGAAYANATVGSTKMNGNGYFGGIGMDYAVSENWTLGGEVLMHRFDDFDGSGIDLEATTATVRASLRF